MRQFNNACPSDKLKTTSKKIAYKSILYLMLASVIASVFSYFPASAASNSSYKYYDSGSQIGATGGAFGSKTTIFDETTEGSGKYQGRKQLTVEWDTGIWPFRTHHKINCITYLEITVTEPGKGSINTYDYYNGHPVVNPVGSNYTGQCTSDDLSHVSNLKLGNITISGKTSDTGQITNPSETDNDRKVAVHAYPKSPPDQLPSDVKVVVSKVTGEEVTRKAIKFPLDMGQVYFTLDPGQYKICITPTSDKFGFDQCQNITKKNGKSLLVTFGDEGSGYNATGNLVAAAAHLAIETSVGDTSYGPIKINLINSSDKTVASVETSNKYVSSADTEVVLDGADFKSVTKPGTYKVCVDGDASLCSKKFKKVKNQQITWNDVPGPLINIPKNKTAQYKHAGTNSDNNDNSCGSQVTGLGWIICPIISSLTKLDDGMWTLVSGLLTVNPINQSGSNSIYQAWGSIRSIANVLFVLFFLMIIFSQLTGMGITNYGVKKLLPKVIVCAILVNISFIIIQLAVDLANVIGSSLYGFIVGMAPEYTIRWGNALNLLEGGAALLTGVAVTVAAVGGFTALFFILLGVVLISALGLITAVLTLIFRQAAILILAILAPLAFVAYLLPNTEQWFKKWRSLLLSMLMMYPMAALIFGGAQFAAATAIGDGKDFWNICIGLTMMALPLFSLPFIARQGGPILSKVNGALKGITQRANQPIRGWAKSRADYHASQFKADNAPLRGGVRGAFQRAGRFASAPSRHLSRAWEGGKQTREIKTEAAKNEFKSQLSNNEVRGTLGRRIDGKATDVRAAAAREALGIDSTETSRRLTQQNPVVNARHGGTSLNERKYRAEGEKEIAEAKNKENLMENRNFDEMRRNIDHSKSDAGAAENLAAERVERDPTTLQVRKRAFSADTVLKTAQKRTEGAIAADTALDVTRTGLEKATTLATAATDAAAGRTEVDTGVRAARVEAAAAKDEKEAAIKGTEEIISQAKMGTPVPGIDPTLVTRAQDASYDLEQATLQAGRSSEQLATVHESDTTLKGLRVGEAAAKKAHETATSQTAQLVTEATTQTVATPGSELASVDAADRASLQASQTAANIAASATSQAERAKTREFTEDLLDPTSTTSQQAAGIEGTAGEARVKASATAAQEKQTQEDISAAESLYTVENYAGGDVPVSAGGTSDLMDAAMGHLRPPAGSPPGALGPSATLEQQMGAMDKLIKTGDLKSMAALQNYIVSLPNGDPRKIRLQQEYGTLLASSSKKPKSTSGGNLGALSTGSLTMTFNDSLVAFAQAGKFGPKVFSEMDKDEVSMLATVLHTELAANPNALGNNRGEMLKAIADVTTDPLYKGTITPEKRAQLDALEQALL